MTREIFCSVYTHVILFWGQSYTGLDGPSQGVTQSIILSASSEYASITLLQMCEKCEDLEYSNALVMINPNLLSEDAHHSHVTALSIGLLYSPASGDGSTRTARTWPCLSDNTSWASPLGWVLREEHISAFQAHILYSPNNKITKFINIHQSPQSHETRSDKAVSIVHLFTQDLISSDLRWCSRSVSHWCSPGWPQVAGFYSRSLLSLDFFGHLYMAKTENANILKN